MKKKSAAQQGDFDAELFCSFLSVPQFVMQNWLYGVS
jgi:hypothetical protein